LGYFLLLARDLRLFADKQLAALQASLYEVRRLLTGLIQQVDPRRFTVNSTKTKNASSQPAHLLPPFQSSLAKT
jgi:hypothetical protein